MRPSYSPQGEAGSRRTAPGDRPLFYALLVILVWAPLPLGSNRDWSVAVLELSIFALLAAWLVGVLRGRVALPGAVIRAWPLWAILGLWMALGLIQVLPMPPGLLTQVSPRSAELWSDALSALGEPRQSRWLTVSLDPYGSLGAWRLGWALIGIAFLVLVLVRSRRRLRLLASVLVFCAVAQAMLASLLALTGQAWWFIDASSRAHGTFANPNHLAGYLEMSIALGVGLLIADLADREGSRTWRRRLLGWTKTLLGPKARLRIYVAILVIALVLTASRMGNIAFFASLAITGAIGVVAARRSPRPVLVLLVSMVLVDLLILGGWFGLDRVRERLERTDVLHEARYAVGIQGRQYQEDFPWLGSGGDSFYAVFPLYRGEALPPVHFAHADNDILELRLEYGGVGLALLAAVVALTLAAAVRVLWRSHDPLLRGMVLGSVMGISALVIHSSADANLQIPANAALFMVLIALPWLALGLEPGGRRGGLNPRRGASD